jgi:predicted transcriptional regulator
MDEKTIDALLQRAKIEIVPPLGNDEIYVLGLAETKGISVRIARDIIQKMEQQGLLESVGKRTRAGANCPFEAWRIVPG